MSSDSLPAGWKLVPEKPTIEMVMAGRGRIFADMTGPHMGPSAEWAYEAMVAVAPEPPEARADSAGPSSHVSETFPESALQTAAERMAASATVWEGFGARDVEACLRYYAEAVCAEPAATTASAPAERETEAGCGYPYCGGNSPECRHCCFSQDNNGGAKP